MPFLSSKILKIGIIMIKYTICIFYLANIPIIKQNMWGGFAIVFKLNPLS